MAVLMASTSVPSLTALRSARRASTCSFSAPSILSPCSRSSFSVWYTSVSAWLRTSASSRRRRSSSAWLSASRTICSMSSLLSDDWPVMVIDCSLPVARSLAATWTMPLASMSKVTSICGTPRGAGGRSTSWNLPRVLLNWDISRSPCSTWISTDGCMSSAVVNTSVRRVGMVVLRSMSLVITPPLVSMPRDSGVTSRSRTSLTSPLSTPAWTAAPMATTSSGLTPLWGSLPVRDWTSSCTAGMRVEPPTRMTWSRAPLSTPGVLDRLLEGDPAALEQVGGELLELGPGEGLVEVDRVAVLGGDEGQADLGLLDLAQLDLGLLGRLLEALDGHVVLGEVDVVGALEAGGEPVDDPLVPVVAAELGVAVGALDLEDAVADLEHRHVEGAAAEVEHEDRLVVGALVEAVGERGGGGLVDDAEHLEAGDLARLLGGGALGVVEVGRDGDDGLGDGVAEVGLGVALELLQRPGADLLGRVGLAVDVDLPAGAHVALDGADRAVGVGDGLALGDLADEHLAALGEGDDRGRGAGALAVGDDDRVAGLEDRDDGVGGAEIDADCLGHGGASVGTSRGLSKRDCRPSVEVECHVDNAVRRARCARWGPPAWGPPPAAWASPPGRPTCPGAHEPVREPDPGFGRRIGHEGRSAGRGRPPPPPRRLLRRRTGGEVTTAGRSRPPPLPRGEGAGGDGETGTITVQLEPTQGIFVEGFAVGLRFTDADGEEVKAITWDDVVAELDPASNPNIYYEAVYEQEVPAGTITVGTRRQHRHRPRTGAAGPAGRPDALRARGRGASRRDRRPRGQLRRRRPRLPPHPRVSRRTGAGGTARTQRPGQRSVRRLSPRGGSRPRSAPPAPRPRAPRSSPGRSGQGRRTRGR